MEGETITFGQNATITIEGCLDISEEANIVVQVDNLDDLTRQNDGNDNALEMLLFTIADENAPSGENENECFDVDGREVDVVFDNENDTCEEISDSQLISSGNRIFSVFTVDESGCSNDDDDNTTLIIIIVVVIGVFLLLVAIFIVLVATVKPIAIMFAPGRYRMYGRERRKAHERKERGLESEMNVVSTTS